jgi:AI-2 transport protein TqsA
MDRPRIERSFYFLMVSASVVIVIAGLRAASSIIVPFLIAVFVAMISIPLQNWLLAHKAPTSLAVLLTILADMLVLVGLALLKRHQSI